jgi:hypothetical protein
VGVSDFLPHGPISKKLMEHQLGLPCKPDFGLHGQRSPRLRRENPSALAFDFGFANSQEPKAKSLLV